MHRGISQIRRRAQAAPRSRKSVKAPDSPRAWLVVAAAFVAGFVVLGITYSFGVLHRRERGCWVDGSEPGGRRPPRPIMDQLHRLRPGGRPRRGLRLCADPGPGRRRSAAPPHSALPRPERAAACWSCRPPALPSPPRSAGAPPSSSWAWVARCSSPACAAMVAPSPLGGTSPHHPIRRTVRSARVRSALRLLGARDDGAVRAFRVPAGVRAGTGRWAGGGLGAALAVWRRERSRPHQHRRRERANRHH